MNQFSCRICLSCALLIQCSLYSQQTISIDSVFSTNGYQRILNNLNAIPSGITLGGYGEMTYNQPDGIAGELDVQRLVMLFGYKFDERVQFVTEIEFEHVKEVYVEQAFLNYSLANAINLRAGLMLVPMGIINEYHEPTTFNGVERPSIDKSVVPTTWRELGFGVSGRSDELSIRYQAYVFNGFLSYTDTSGGILSGKNGLRSGRQKGMESVFTTPNFSAKVDYFGTPGLRLGLSYYVGRTQALTDPMDVTGTTVGVQMVGFDARMRIAKWSGRGQYIHSALSDTEEYNRFTNADLGSRLSGFYLETAYNILPLGNRQRIDAFVRYEHYDTHAAVANGIEKKEAFFRKEWTMGFSYHLSQGTVFKMDYQIKNNASPQASPSQFNVGVGVWF